MQLSKLSRGNRAASAPGLDASILMHFAQVAERYAERPALGGESVVSYRDLDRLSDGVAQVLCHELGIRAGATVALLCGRSSWLVIGQLGILKAGAAFLPLDTRCPPERLRFILTDAGVDLLLFDDTPDGSDWAGRRLQIADLTRGTPARRALPTPRAQDPAYVVYTSGSTGKPKGVVVEHATLSNLCRWHVRSFAVNPESRTTLVADVGFDASIWEIWPYLTAGASLHPVPEGCGLSADRLLDRLSARRPTHAFLPTLACQQLLRESHVPPFLVLTGGSQLCGPIPPGARVVNNYGLTETGVVATSGRARPSADPGPVPIGWAIDNSEVFVGDPSGRRLPAGERGEIFVAGRALARGYVRGELEAERFVWVGMGGARRRLLRTGDFGHHLSDGAIVFEGRQDDQVDLNGYRVELGEVEAELSRLPEVHSAAVVLDKPNGDAQALVAYVVAPTLSRSEALSSALARVLPGHMIPRYVVRVDALPSTASGKIDKSQLKTSCGTLLADGAQPAAASGALEEHISRCAQRCLARPTLARTEDFFRLGADSLTVVQLASMLNRELDLPVTPQLVFRHPSVGALADALRGAEPRPAQASPGPAEAARAPASPAQQSMWLACRDHDRALAYSAPFGYRVKGALQPELLAKALLQVVERHSGLRTRFALEDGELTQSLAPAADALHVELHDYRAQGAEQALCYLLERAEAPFDLTEDELVRLYLLRVAADEWLTLLNIHHIVVDGVSMRALNDDWSRCYAALAQGLLPENAAPRLDCIGFTAWQLDALATGTLGASQAHWQERLARPARPAGLPLDRARAGATWRSRSVAVPLSGKALARLRAWCGESRATLFGAIIAAVGALVQRYAGALPVRLGVPFSGRADDEHSRLVGCFVNTVPVDIDAQGKTPTALLQAVQAQLAQGLDHQHFPVELLLSPASDGEERREAWSTVVVSEHDEGLDAAAWPFDVRRVPVPRHIAFDTVVAMQSTGGRVSLEIRYREDLFDPASIAAHAEELAELLTHFAEQPQRPLS